MQTNSTDRVRCHPWSALIFWNAKIKQYAWPPSTFPMDPTPVFSIIYQKIITFHPAELFFLFFLGGHFWPKWPGMAIVCETTDVSRETATLPIFQKTWFQAILAKKKTKKKTQKTKNHRVRRFYGVRRSCRVRGFYSMCTSLAVECDALAGVRRICGMRRIPSMRGWYRDHIGKFRGQNQNSNPKASPNLQGHTSGFYFSEFTLGEAPGKKLSNFLLSQPLKTLPLTTLSFFGRKWRNFLIKAAFNSFNVHSCFGTT